MIHEDVYGHAKRLKWIISYLKKGDQVLEIGCGTGFMISFQLANMGFSIRGIDSDPKSIEYGRKIFQKEGLDPENLQLTEHPSINITPDVIIASEFLEHLSDQDIVNYLKHVRKTLRPGGYFLVTVPNGFGCFEIENLFWKKFKLGGIIMASGIERLISKLKRVLLGRKLIYYPHPSTLSSSPHIQRFSHNAIQRLLVKHDFEIIETSGSVLFAGPFSNLIFHDIPPIVKFNCFLGKLLPKMAAGFFIACKAPKKS